MFTQKQSNMCAESQPSSQPARPGLSFAQSQRDVHLWPHWTGRQAQVAGISAPRPNGEKPRNHGLAELALQALAAGRLCSPQGPSLGHNI